MEKSREFDELVYTSQKTLSMFYHVLYVLSQDIRQNEVDLDDRMSRGEMCQPTKLRANDLG